MFDGPGLDFGDAMRTVLSALFSLLVLVVIVALIFLLVRFLLIATKAAQLYIAQHDGKQRQSPRAAEPAARSEEQTTAVPVSETDDTSQMTRPIPPTKSSSRAKKPPASES